MNALSLPLLAKELTEIAARRRTYITRVVYALLLYGCFAAMQFPRLKYAGTNPLGAMGIGGGMFLTLIFLQLIGIYFFLPAFTAGLITQEKERDSLVLLFLTELKPWQILLQKYASGLLSIFSFLLIGLPLAAFCYAYGGISTAFLFQGVMMLLLTSLQVAAFALLCSAWARTTVGAFIGTYVGAGLFAGLVALAGGAAYFLIHGKTSDDYVETFMHVFPVAMFGRRGNATIPQTLLLSVAPLVSTFVFLLLARFFFVRRAFAPARNRLLGLFRRLDAMMQSGNRFLGNVSFRNRERALPEDDPIAWREMTRTALGRPHYLVRLLVGLEILTIALCLWAVKDGSSGSDNEMLSLLIASIGTLAVLGLSALAANAFVSERISQTLEVLLTTTLTARDIVRQKARMLTRLLCVLAVPLATVFVVEAWAEDGIARWRWPEQSWEIASPGFYLLWALLSLAVYLPLVLWLSLWIGLKMRTRFRAILTALGVIVTWCVLPVLLGVIFEVDSGKGNSFLMAFSPLTVPAMNEFGNLWELFPGWETRGLLLNFLFYGSLALFFRRRSLREADRYLRK